LIYIKSYVDSVTERSLIEGALRRRLKIVNDRVTVDLSQNQVDALASLTFNANVGGIQVLAPRLNAGDLAAMPGLITKTKTNIGALVPRRNREANSFDMATISRKSDGERVTPVAAW